MSCFDIEVDYDKKEIRAKNLDSTGKSRNLSRDFGQITHYKFEYIRKERAEGEKESGDSCDRFVRVEEIMSVHGACEELADFTPEEERLAIAQNGEVRLKLVYFYYGRSDVTTSYISFSQENAFEARRKLKALIKYLQERGLKDMNIFVGSEHLRIADIVNLNIPYREFNQAITSWRIKEKWSVFYINLPKFGECSISIMGYDDNLNVNHVKLSTSRLISEEEMLPMFEYMKESMPIGDFYDDGGYGLLPEPHRVNHFWPLPQGEVHMRWDGFGLGRRNGKDSVEIELKDCTLVHVLHDEEYWRSEVD